MAKKHTVRLSNSERETLHGYIKRQSGTSTRVRRAHILLKADADGPAWPDTRIAEAFDCSVTTVENVRKRLVFHGFDVALRGKKRDSPPVASKFTGEKTAELLALRTGEPPEGYANWSLRLLARKAVELCIVDSLSHEHARRVLKKAG